MLDLLQKPDFVVFTTRDAAVADGVSVSAASRRLTRIAEGGAIKRVTKGVWANTQHPHFHPLSCVPYLLGKEQGYVSFLSALHLHAALSQIPAVMMVATTGHGRKLDSPVGRFEFFRVKPELMRDGVAWSDTRQPYLMATPEKALLDVLYLSTRKKRRFSRLPELILSDSGFRVTEFRRLLKSLPYSKRVRSAINSRWEGLAPQIS